MCVIKSQWDWQVWQVSLKINEHTVWFGRWPWRSMSTLCSEARSLERSVAISGVAGVFWRSMSTLSRVARTLERSVGMFGVVGVFWRSISTLCRVAGALERLVAMSGVEVSLKVSEHTSWCCGYHWRSVTLSDVTGVIEDQLGNLELNVSLKVSTTVWYTVCP